MTSWLRRAATVPLLVVLAALASWGLPTAAWATASPIQPSNQPTPVAGQTNGEMSNSQLVNVAPQCQAYRPAAASLGLLLAEAREQGVVLSTDQCYRPLSDQVAVQQSWTASGNSACAAPVTTTPSGQKGGTSMHGWGKAADFSVDGAPFSAGSPLDRWLHASGAQVGWNHPGWAEPGGSACPEPWHYEWVGDGGTQAGTPIRADVVGLIPSPDDKGYLSVNGLGGVTARGDAVDRGSAAGIPINWLVVGAAATPDRGGYWEVGSDGGIFSFGDAAFFGSTGSIRLNQPIVGLAPTPSGNGYWLVAADGGVFSFGDASFYGSTGGMHLNRPVVGMAPTPSGHGYFLVASDGGIFTFGDAGFQGSTGGMALNRPVVGMVSTSSGNGYWLVASDGGVFNFGDAGFLGSAGGQPPAEPVTGLARTLDGKGYWIVAADGTVAGFGDAPGFGSA